jgi:hypothetical protein
MITSIGPNDDPTQPSTPVDDGTETFDSFAASMPETASGFLDAALPRASDDSVKDGGGGDFFGSAGSEETTPAPERKRVNVTKKVRKAMDRFKVKVANVPIMWFHSQAKSNPEWELDADEKAMLKDAVETVFDVLDIGVEIEPLSWTLTSVWWVLSYPVLAFVFLFLTKKSLTMQDGDGEQQPDVDVQP